MDENEKKSHTTQHKQHMSVFSGGKHSHPASPPSRQDKRNKDLGSNHKPRLNLCVDCRRLAPPLIDEYVGYEIYGDLGTTAPASSSSSSSSPSGSEATNSPPFLFIISWNPIITTTMLTTVICPYTRVWMSFWLSLRLPSFRNEYRMPPTAGSPMPTCDTYIGRQDDAQKSNERDDARAENKTRARRGWWDQGGACFLVRPFASRSTSGI